MYAFMVIFEIYYFIYLNIYSNATSFFYIIYFCFILNSHSIARFSFDDSTLWMICKFYSINSVGKFFEESCDSSIYQYIFIWSIYQKSFEFDLYSNKNTICFFQLAFVPCFSILYFLYSFFIFNPFTENIPFLTNLIF